MKKVKVLLTAITVFAVVGGALAFKSQSFGGNRWCSTQPDAAPVTTTTYSESIESELELYCTNSKTGKTGITVTSVTFDLK